VWLDPLPLYQPVQHLGRAVSGVADQPGGIEIEAFARALDHPLGAVTSAWRIAVVASTSTMIALSTSIR
jgi:hypothetical protein